MYVTMYMYIYVHVQYVYSALLIKRVPFLSNWTQEQYHFCYVAVLDYLLHHGFLNQKNNRSASVERRASVKLTKSVSPEQLLTDMDDDHTADGQQEFTHY